MLIEEGSTALQEFSLALKDVLADARCALAENEYAVLVAFAAELVAAEARRTTWWAWDRERRRWEGES